MIGSAISLFSGKEVSVIRLINEVLVSFFSRRRIRYVNSVLCVLIGV